jgi:mannose-6-phosphate isomerase-like protein (cupin superfamily)
MSEHTYHCIDPEELSPTPEYPCDRRPVSDEADLGLLAAAVYELAPGEQLPRTYHYHEQREELFSVREGTLTVETPDGEYTVEAGEIFVAHPESPHRPYNPDTADESVVVFGVGAPSTDIARPYHPDG